MPSDLPVGPREFRIGQPEMRLFLSYSFEDEKFAARVSFLLRKQPGLEPFLYGEERGTTNWGDLLVDKIKECDAFVYLGGNTRGKTQEEEARLHFAIAKGVDHKTVMVILPGGSIPEALFAKGFDPIRCPDDVKDPADYVARQISVRLTKAWCTPDGVPLGYLFSSEKKVIATYVDKEPDSAEYRRLLENGGPADWPRVVKYEANRENSDELQKTIGDFGEEASEISVTARTGYLTGGLSFPEARPRRRHRYPLLDQARLKVAIVVSGGIAPGINAVIHGIVKRHELYRDSPSSKKRYRLEIFGHSGGLQSLVSDSLLDLSPAQKGIALEVDVDREAEKGGSLLATSRWDAFVEGDAWTRDRLLREIVSQLKGRSIQILYVIGGDGSMRAAHAIWKTAQELLHPGDEPLSVIGIPKTVDNDILWVWQSFGFLSAVEKAREQILNMHTEVESNPRLCILQVFGSDSGFVASHASLASGVCDAVLIPEVDYTMEGLFDHLEQRLVDGYQKTMPHGLVVMAETAIPVDALSYVEGFSDPEVKPAKETLQVKLSEEEVDAIMQFFKEDRRVRGQTPDHLRKAGLSIVSGVLQKMIEQRMTPKKYWGSFRVFTIEPRHLIRSIPPSTSDVIFAERLGTLAVDNAMAGYTDFMVSQWLTEFVLVPLELVTLGRKRVPPNGIFWKSVVASTGQPPDMNVRH